jgi:hypothetical protein
MTREDISVILSHLICDNLLHKPKETNITVVFFVFEQSRAIFFVKKEPLSN